MGSDETFSLIVEEYSNNTLRSMYPGRFVSVSRTVCHHLSMTL